MKLRIFDPRIVAIDLRFRRSGFAVFEGSKILLDSGTIAIPPSNGDGDANRLSDLLNLTSPAFIVVKTERWEGMQARSRTGSLIQALRHESDKRSIALHGLDEHAVAQSFRNLGCSTKGEIADALIRIFPELEWKLPPKRDIWDSEHSRQSIFDAVALGFASWQHETAVIADLDSSLG